jgi:glyoxylase-like metal-dependent hydrolase (beta-lactamase superfamily II)
MSHPIARLGLRAAAVLAALALPVLAPAQDFSQVAIRATELAPDFHTLQGQGGTLSVLSGPDGVLVVDAQFAPLTDRLVAAIRAFSDKPIRFLVDTHVHPDHTGGNENFARLGATILARDQLRERLEKPATNLDGSVRPAQPAAALPVVTYDAPVSLYLDGEHVVLMPVRRAHTDGDTVVIFPGHDIMAVGDIFRSLGYPYVDRASGGTLAGTLEALSEVADRAGPATRIIPGHGAIVGREALLAQRDMILELRAQVLAQVQQGRTLEQVIASRPTAAWDAKVPQGAQTADRFVKWVYEEVVADR